MTDDERKLLAYVAVKQVEMNVFLKSLVPVVIHLSSLRDEDKTDQTRKVALNGLKQIIAPQLKSEIELLLKLCPQMQKLLLQIGSSSSEDARKALKDYFEIRD